ncbi:MULTISPECIES: helix-turn-helix domain-containing protein [Streptacidiphilus]|uniref:Helix-turn-helix domain-containing protein n=1 Tax=Streptacidiphilus cavernicola TaxID=3342716 RepID=A0ABV6UXD8_9ACTN|nr:helix-turn-helix transcriptional regulator [Streptacidiphilus jeojiense]
MSTTNQQPRHCVRCSHRLARDNREPLCASCQQNARTTLARAPQVPEAFWRTNHMRDALDSWHMGAVFRAYRGHLYHGRPITQEALACWLDLTQAQLSRIEKGDAPQELTKLTKWAQALGIPGDVLWFKLPDQRRPARPQSGNVVPAQRVSTHPPAAQPEASSDGWSHMTDMERRAFLARSLAAVALPTVGLEDLSHLVAALDNSRRYLDADVVDHFRAQITACGTTDGTQGPKETLPVVLGILGAIESHARQVKPQVRRDLLRVGAQAAEFAGWLYRDVGVPSMAAYWRDRATEWAQEASDFVMQGYVLLKKSQSAWDDRDGLRMLTLAQAAQEGPWQLPVKVRAEAAQQEARGHAMTGGDLAMVERKLDEAHQLLADAPSGDDSGQELGALYSSALLAMQTAICYCEAGQGAKAAELYQSHLSAGVFSRRDYGYFLSLRAGALAQAGEPEEAARLSMEALPVATATNSTRTTGELLRVADMLRPWADVAAVLEFTTAVSN